MFLLCLILSLGNLKEIKIEPEKPAVFLPDSYNVTSMGSGILREDAFLEAFSKIPLMYRPFVKKIMYEEAPCRVICLIVYKKF